MNLKLIEDLYYNIAEQIEQAAQEILDEYPTDKAKQAESMLKLLSATIAHFSQNLPGMTAEHVHYIVNQTFDLKKKVEVEGMN